jgi:predicted HTH transcriptional regulator
MEFNELRALVRQGEGQKIEFKKKTVYPHKIMKEVVAFANAQGGFLIIGVADNGEITGVKHPEEELYVMRKALASYAFPLIKYKLYRIPMPRNDEMEVLVFEVEESKQKPVMLIEDFENQTGKVYIRSRDQSLQASKEMVKILSKQGESVVIKIGRLEKKLFEFLDVRKKTDVQSFADFAKIPYRLASKIMVQLTLSNVLKIFPQEGGGDLFEQNI